MMLSLFPLLFTSVVLARPFSPSARPYLDGPHVALASENASPTDPWQWWYFDMVSTDPESRASLQVVFYSAFGMGFFTPNEPYYVQVTGNFPNGTAIEDTVWFASGLGEVENVPRLAPVGTSGKWPGVGKWTASGSDEDHMQYVVDFELPAYPGQQVAVSGSMTLKQTAPSHYPCDSWQEPNLRTGANLIGPYVGWANAVPGAIASAKLTVGGDEFEITGNGYHDTNFGDIPVYYTVATWYWARGVVGPYTFVFSTYLPQNSSISASDPNNWYTLGYLAENGVQLVNFCSYEQTVAQHKETNIHIETRGPIWTVGPNGADGAVESAPEQISVRFEKGEETWTFVLDSADVVTNTTSYLRWTADVSGGQGALSQGGGKGMFEILEIGV